MVYGVLIVVLVIVVGYDYQCCFSYIVIGLLIDFCDELELLVCFDEVGIYVVMVLVVLDIVWLFWEVVCVFIDDFGECCCQGYYFNLVILVVSVVLCCMVDVWLFMVFMEVEGLINLCFFNIGCYLFFEWIGVLCFFDVQFFIGILVNGYFVVVINFSYGWLFWNFIYIDEVVFGECVECLVEDCLGILLLVIYVF